MAVGLARGVGLSRRGQGLREPQEVLELGQSAPRGAISKIFGGLRSQPGGETEAGVQEEAVEVFGGFLSSGAAGGSCMAPKFPLASRGPLSEGL